MERKHAKKYLEQLNISRSDTHDNFRALTKRMKDTKPFLAICVLAENRDGTPGDQKADFQEIGKSLGTFSSVCRPEYNPYDTKERVRNTL